MHEHSGPCCHQAPHCSCHAARSPNWKSGTYVFSDQRDIAITHSIPVSFLLHELGKRLTELGDFCCIGTILPGHIKCSLAAEGSVAASCSVTQKGAVDIHRLHSLPASKHLNRFTLTLNVICIWKINVDHQVLSGLIEHILSSSAWDMPFQAN